MLDVNLVSHTMRGYYARLHEVVVEDMHAYNQTGEPVAIVVHSVGGPMSLYFLNIH